MVRDPSAYYDNNVAGTITLLRAAQAASIDKLVFSSTCATYGVPSSIPIDEAHAQSPINPYGRSKLIVEQILKDLDLYQGFSRQLKKSERAVKNHEQIGIKTGPFIKSKCGDIEFFNSLLGPLFCAILTLREPTLKEELANGIRLKLTPYPLQSRPH